MAELVVKLSQKLEPQAARTSEEEGRQQDKPGPNRDRLTVGVDLGDKWSAMVRGDVAEVGLCEFRSGPFG